MLAHFAHHLLTALPIPLLPFIRKEFNLDYTRSTFVVTMFSLSSGAGQLPSGWLADRIGPTILIMVGILGVAVAGALVGISQTYVLPSFACIRGFVHSISMGDISSHLCLTHAYIDNIWI